MDWNLKQLSHKAKEYFLTITCWHLFHLSQISLQRFNRDILPGVPRVRNLPRGHRPHNRHGPRILVAVG